MLGAAVPKAAINEYGDTQPGKNEVRSPPEVTDRLAIHVEAQTKRVNGSTQFELWSSVTPSVRLHTYAHTG
jgi:hypothetical protein